MDLVMDIDIRIYSGVLMHAYLMRTVHAGGHFHSAGLYVPELSELDYQKLAAS